MEKLSEQILAHFPEAEIKSMESPTRGAFEVSINSVVVHSRIKSGSYPNADEITKYMRDAQNRIPFKAAP